jgi:hypothetical protein
MIPCSCPLSLLVNPDASMHGNLWPSAVCYIDNQSSLMSRNVSYQSPHYWSADAVSHSTATDRLPYGMMSTATSHQMAPGHYMLQTPQQKP